jgi:hypothetical protein
MNLNISSRLKVLILLAGSVFAVGAGNSLPAWSQESEVVDQDAMQNDGMDQDGMNQDSGDQDSGDQDSGDQDSGDQDSGDQDSGDQDSAGQQKLAAASVDEPDQQAAQAVAGLPARSPHEGVSMDLFGRKTWYTPPPAAPVREVRTYQPAAPTAPPLPFSVMGSYEEEGKGTLYFLVKGDRVFDARVGDILEGTYRVDGPSNGQLKFTYLPLDISQGTQLGEGQ